MVHKEVCPNCRGNKWVTIQAPDGKRKPLPCPHCGGNGYRVRVTQIQSDLGR